MDQPKFIVSNQNEESISTFVHMVKNGAKSRDRHSITALVLDSGVF